MIAAARAYQNVGTRAHVGGADPHALVQILFDEALADLRQGERAITRGDLAAKSAHLSRASTIVAALDGSLDHAKGGEVASSLAQVYAVARARITRASLRNDPAEARAAADALSEVASAWRSIALPQRVGSGTPSVLAA